MPLKPVWCILRRMYIGSCALILLPVTLKAELMMYSALDVLAGAKADEVRYLSCMMRFLFTGIIPRGPAADFYLLGP